MAIAVLDIDIDNIPEEVTGLSAYVQALVLVRLNGRPVAQISVPVDRGRIGRTELVGAVANSLSWPIWKQWIRDYLHWSDWDQSTTPPPSATVAICTRDRPDDLRRCLRALRMLLEPAPLEVVVIDNAPSTDATRKVVESESGVRYLLELRAGLDVARNRAMREARGEVVAFVDDDAVPDRAWLRSLLRNFEDPMVAAVAGLTVPLELETDAQETHERISSFNRGFKRRVFDGRFFNPAAAGQIGAGVNMALRRSVFDELGEFDEALDAGTKTRSGGDTEMFARVLHHGYRIVYDPEALCWHRHRRTWRELRAMIHGYGIGVYAWWTSFALSQRYIWMVKPALHWFLGSQLPAVYRGIRYWHRNAPLDLAVTELTGCLAGPWAYLSARMARRKERAG